MGAKETSGGQRRNKEKNNQKKCFPMQVLYDTCKEVFENGGPGIVPSIENVQKLKDAMSMSDDFVYVLLFTCVFTARSVFVVLLYLS